MINISRTPLIGSRLEQLVRDLRTALRARRALERDLDSSWEANEELQHALRSARSKIEDLEAENLGLRSKLRSEQCITAQQRMQIDSLCSSNRPIDIRTRSVG